MINKNKLIRIAVAIGAVAIYALVEQYQGNQTGPTVESGLEQDNTALRQAVANKNSDVQVTGFGRVIKVLPDDTRGSKHQKFLIKLDSGEKILIAHNIDLAPRVAELNQGDHIRFNGEFEWNDKGGVIHWTHKDPRSKHIHGWLEHNGTKYW